VFVDAGIYQRFSVTTDETPTHLSVEAGAVQFPTLPTAAHFGRVSTEAGQRLSELALHEHSLIEAEAAALALEGLTDEVRVSALGRALWTALSVSYVRCFNSPSRFKLDPRVVFGDRDLASLRMSIFATCGTSITPMT
jgi:hypothetical protein